MKVFGNARVYADTRDMSRDEWLELRREGIGGSEASAILGLNPYSSPLRVYLDKISDEAHDETNEAMRQGTDLEAYVAQRFCEETGLKVKKRNQILQSIDYPWMRANIDRQIIGQNAGLECKTTSAYSKFKFDEGEINPHYYWQSMHYMAVTGADKWYVAILVLGKSFHVFEIARDEEAIMTLIGAEQTFWEEHVMKKVPPLPTGSEADDEVVASLYPMGEDFGSEAFMDLDSGLDEALNLRELKVRERDALNEQIAEIDQQVKLAMGDFQRGVSAGWRVSWSNFSTSRLDTKALKKAHPDIVDEFTKTTQSRRFSVARVNGNGECT